MNYTEEIKLLTQLGSDASQAALAEYTRYFIISSIWWACVCAALFAGLCFLLKKIWNTEERWCELEKWALFTLVSVVAIVFLLGAADNVSDLLNPRAMAIHQLLKDLRG